MKRWRWFLLIGVVVGTIGTLLIAQNHSVLEEGDEIELDDPEASPEPAQPPAMQEGEETELEDPEAEGTRAATTRTTPTAKSSEKTIAAKTDQKAQAKSTGLRDWLDQLPFEFKGFAEQRVAVRTQNDPDEHQDLLLGDTRLQLEASKFFEIVELRVKSDFLYDANREEFRVDLRELNFVFFPAQWIDIKIGRQVLTWGTGDLIFINDLFPKDYVAFFSGREDSYLKSPADAAKFAWTLPWVNVDFVYIPKFNEDQYLDGQRIAIYDPLLEKFRGEANYLRTVDRDTWFRDSEYAWRVFKNIEKYELAAYGYYGYWKTPQGFDPQTGKYTFPRLFESGISAQGAVAQGILYLEMGYYYSLQDTNGDNPLIPNSQLLFLVGYSREVATDFTVAVQYYLEYNLQYRRLRDHYPPGRKPSWDEVEHLLTLRLTKLLLKQNMTVSLFTFYSPSANDAYLRPHVKYKMSDNWTIDIGGNIFLGEDKKSFFGQFQKTTNVYAGIRWNF